MEHLILKAATTATDVELGQFEALVSAWEADRVSDTIAPTAFDKTIKAWQASQKNLPLLWEHENEVVGFIDPASMVTTKDGLVVRGEIDRDSPKGPAAWRMIKSGVAGFSIGFISESRPNPDGKGQHLEVIDLLECSVTAKPCHPAARTLSWKTARPSDEHLENHSDPSGELARLAEFFAQDPDEVVREAKIKQEIEAKAVAAERRSSLTVSRFDVEVQ